MFPGFLTVYTKMRLQPGLSHKRNMVYLEPRKVSDGCKCCFIPLRELTPLNPSGDEFEEPLRGAKREEKRLRRKGKERKGKR